MVAGPQAASGWRSGAALPEALPTWACSRCSKRSRSPSHVSPAQAWAASWAWPTRAACPCRGSPRSAAASASAISAAGASRAAAQMGPRCVVGVSVGFNNWNGEAPKNLFQVVSRAVSAAQKNGGVSWEAAADILLEPDVQTIDWDEFHRADEAIAAGAAAARRALPRIRELLRMPASAQPEAIRPSTGATGWPEEQALR